MKYCKESKCRGFTVIIDRRDGSWSNLVTLLGCLKQSLGEYLKQVLVLRTEEMDNMQPSSSSFRRERGPNIEAQIISGIFEPQFINLNRLYTYVDRNQLIGSMGGTLMYHHTYWLQNRLVVDWILGPGEKLLASQSDIGDSFERAETLRKCHEELEIKCTDTYGHYAELRHLAEDVLNMPTFNADDIRAQRDYMDIVCRSFATRLERRRNLLITSVRFHRLTEEFSRKLDNFLEVLYNEKEADTVEAAQEALEHLQEKLDEIDQAASRAVQDGQSLLDEMSRPVKNAAGKDISPDYAKQMKHVNQRLEDLQERKMRCDDLADVRKLRLQHFLELRKCEQETEKTISWIVELCEVMLTAHTHIGQTQQDIEQLQDKHKELETTARKTYQYGQQLLQASLDLRQSLRLTLEPNASLAKRLDEAWKKFSLGNNEQTNRLNVASMFLAQSDKLWERIEQLMVVVAQTLTGDVLVQNALTRFGPEKYAVEKEVKDTSRMGKALLERLSLPVIVVDGQERSLSKEDQSAIESVNSRLRKLDHKITELNRYWLEMEQTGQPPYVMPKFSKSSLQPYPFSQGQQSVSLPQRDQKYETLPLMEQTNLSRQSYPFDQSQKSASLPARKKDIQVLIIKTFHQ